MPTEFVDKWKHAKQVFQTTTKTKKPSAEVDSFFRKPAGIDSALAKVDAALANANKDAKGLKAFQDTVSGFVVAKNAYYKTLEGAVNKVPKGADHDVYVHGLTVLKTELTSLESTLKGRIANAQSAINKESATEMTAKNLLVNAEGACHRALAFTAKAKATPTAAYFNANIVKAARDITQQIGNVDKLKAMGYHFEHEQPTNLFTILKAWGNDGRIVHVSAPQNEKAEVLREINAFQQAVEGVERWIKGEE